MRCFFALNGTNKGRNYSYSIFVTMKEGKLVPSNFVFVLLISSCALTWALDNRTLTFNEDSHEIPYSDSVSIDELHLKGVEAYLENDWDGCIKYFTAAAKEYRAYVKATVKCRIRCHSQSDDEPEMFPYDVEHLHFYETAVRTTLCLLKCKKAAFKNKFVSVSPELDKLYSKMKPYEYLHLCYYQKKMLQKAASASFTALVANPENNAMNDNLKFYSSLPEVDINKIENLETKAFVPMYIQGVEAYNRGDFASVINFLEQSLKKWLRGVEECRAYCESPFDQGWLPDFISSVSNHFTFCLRCKQKCETSLNSLNGEYHEDMLPSHYHYLQYSYYKVSKLQKACEAVESYLLFLPNEETMIKNKQFYLKYLNGNMDYFIPRKEAVKYVQRQKYENQLLDFIDTEFKKITERVEDGDSEEETNEIHS